MQVAGGLLVWEPRLREGRENLGIEAYDQRTKPRSQPYKGGCVASVHPVLLRGAKTSRASTLCWQSRCHCFCDTMFSTGVLAAKPLAVKARKVASVQQRRVVASAETFAKPGKRGKDGEGKLKNVNKCVPCRTIYLSPAW